jgi:hypothetical protein
LLFELERSIGFGGLILLFSATLCAAFFFLYLRSGPAPYIAGVLTLFGAWTTAPVWGVRPQVLSLLLTSLWLLLLERSERNPKLLWWTPPLMLLWVNLHAAFALGLALSALFLLGEWIENKLAHRSQRSLRHPALIFLLDLLIVPLNPNGLRMYSYPFETLRSPAIQNYIVEWASPNFHRPEYWLFLLIILSTFAVLTCSRPPLRPRDLLLLLISLYASLCSIRMIPLFILIAVPLIAKRLGNWPRTSPRLQRNPASRTALNAVIVVSMAIFVTIRITQVIQHLPQAESQQFPAGAVAYLQSHSPAGPIFNHYDWGGYLIWNLYPTTPVFIDGRTDLYGEPLLHDFADLYQFRGPWRQILQRWQIQTVVVPRDSALATGLCSAPGWTVTYQDSQATILTSSPAPAQNEHASN